MPHDKDSVAKKLAEAHYAIEPGITHIIRMVSTEREDDAAEPIKLLEVNANTTAMGIRPVFFGANAARGIYFPAVIVQVTPDEFEGIQRTPDMLPNQWMLGSELHRMGESVRH